MEEKDLGSYIVAYLRPLPYIGFALGFVGLAKAVANAASSADHVIDIVDMAILFSILLIAFLALILLPPVLGRPDVRYLDIVKGKPRFGRKDLVWSLATGLSVIVLSSIAIVMVEDIRGRAVLFLFLLSGCEFVIFGVHFYVKSRNELMEEQLD